MGNKVLEMVPGTQQAPPKCPYFVIIKIAMKVMWSQYDASELSYSPGLSLQVNEPARSLRAKELTSRPFQGKAGLDHLSSKYVLIGSFSN